jgi:hypothetical protein
MYLKKKNKILGLFEQVKIVITCLCEQYKVLKKENISRTVEERIE